MKSIIKALYLLLLVAHCSATYTMLSRTSQAMRQQRTLFSPTRQRLVAQSTLLQARHMTQPVKTVPASATSTNFFTRIQNSIQTYWNNFKNMFTPQQPVTVKSDVSTPTIPNQETIIQDDLNQLINTVENKLKKLKPVQKKTDALASPELTTAVQTVSEKFSIKCPNPTEEIRHLLRMKSLSTYEKYIKSKKRSLLKKMGFSTEEINALEKQVNSNIAQFMQIYKQAKSIKNHDQTLSSFELNVAEQLLRKVGIEPSSIPIRSTTKYPDLSDAGGAILLENLQTKEVVHNLKTFDLNKLVAYIQQVLCLSPGNNRYTQYEKIYFIAHEIGHLIQGHQIEGMLLAHTLSHVVVPRKMAQYTTELQKSKYDKVIRMMIKKFETLNEIEADIWVAIKYKNIAEIIRNMAADWIRRGGDRSDILPDIYLTPAEKLYVLTKTIQLHEKTEEKNNNNMPDTTKE